MAYITLADLKEWIPFPFETPDPADDILNDCILDAQSFIEGDTHRKFESLSTETRIYGPQSATGDILYLTEDLVSVTTLDIGGEIMLPADYTLLPLNVSNKRQIILRNTAPVSWWNNAEVDSISIEGNWGFSLSPDDEIIRATRLISADAYQQRKALKDGGNRDMVSPSGVVIKATNIPKSAREILHRKRRRY